MRISDWSSDVCSSDLLIPYPFETEQHDAHVADARACSQRIMNAKRQHLPPQALAGTRRQGRNTSGAPKMEKASKRDHRRPVLLPSCEAEHKRDTSVRSEEHTSELPAIMRISYAVLCLKKKTSNEVYTTTTP